MLNTIPLAHSDSWNNHSTYNQGRTVLILHCYLYCYFQYTLCHANTHAIHVLSHLYTCSLLQSYQFVSCQSRYMYLIPISHTHLTASKPCLVPKHNTDTDISGRSTITAARQHTNRPLDISHLSFDIKKNPCTSTIKLLLKALMHKNRLAKVSH